jgi:hypothetical protein
MASWHDVLALSLSDGTQVDALAADGHLMKKTGDHQLWLYLHCGCVGVHVH